MTDTNQRKISVKLSLPDTSDFTMTILPADTTSIAGLDTHPVITRLSETSNGGAGQIKLWMEQLIARNEEFISWLEIRPENSILFVHDPIAAIRQALPDLPQSFYEQLSALYRLNTAK